MTGTEGLDVWKIVYCTRKTFVAPPYCLYVNNGRYCIRGFVERWHGHELKRGYRDAGHELKRGYRDAGLELKGGYRDATYLGLFTFVKRCRYCCS
jgi:hypothetical protein